MEKKKRASEKTYKINAIVVSRDTSSRPPDYQDWFRYLFWLLWLFLFFIFFFWVLGAGSGCLVLFLGIWSWKWERMTSDPLSVLPSCCHCRHRCCRLLWKWLPERIRERGIGIRIGVWFLFCCCFLSLLLREDKSWVGLFSGLLLNKIKS